MLPIIDLKRAVIYIRDAGANYITVRVGEGTLTYSVKRNIIFKDSRGILDRVREGNQQPCEVGFQFVWDYITTHSGQSISIEDALNKRGGASAWQSTNFDVDAPYSIDMQIDYTPYCNQFPSESLYFSQFYYSELAHEIKAGTIDCRGLCNIVSPVIS